MSWIKKNLKKLWISLVRELAELDASAKKLRQFGYLIGSILVILAFVSMWRKEEASILAILFLAAGILLIIFAWGSPLTLRSVYRIWMSFALLLGLIVGTVLLFFLFYLVLTPVGAMRRIFGNDPLERRFLPAAKTYWKQHEKRAVEHMRRPF